MNIIARKRRMNTNDAVQTIATVIATVEKGQRKAISNVRKLRDEFQSIHDNGDAGAMATMSAFADLDALVTSQYAETLRLHKQLTETAQNLGMDVGPLPQDGEDGGISIMSGGGR